MLEILKLIGAKFQKNVYGKIHMWGNERSRTHVSMGNREPVLLYLMLRTKEAS